MNILVMAPHNDDEVLGAGGTMKQMADQGHDVFVCEVTSGAHFEQLKEEARKAHAVLGVKEAFFLQFPVGQLRTSEQSALNDAIRQVVDKVRPEIVFLPFVGDMHLDHREVTESAMVALRPIGDYSVREIYMYETLSETGWNIPDASKSFIPNVWVDISQTIETKLQAMQCYQSQLLKYPHPRSTEAIEALSKFRGTTVGVAHAESFMLVRRIIR